MTKLIIVATKMQKFDVSSILIFNSYIVSTISRGVTMFFFCSKQLIISNDNQHRDNNDKKKCSNTEHTPGCYWSIDKWYIIIHSNHLIVLQNQTWNKNKPRNIMFHTQYTQFESIWNSRYRQNSYINSFLVWLTRRIHTSNVIVFYSLLRTQFSV